MKQASHETAGACSPGSETCGELQVRTAAGRGVGVFTAKPFQAGDVVVAGAIAEVLDGNSAHASQIGDDQYVLFAGLFNLVNHSCDPNCGVRVNETGAYDLVAIRRLEENDQVTFDYAMGNYRIDYFPGPCRCGSANCRGRVTGWKDLPEETKLAYKGVVAPYVLDLDDRRDAENRRTGGGSGAPSE